MSRFRRPYGLTIWPMLLALLLALLWAAGCVRPSGPQSDSGAARADQHQVPFQSADGSAVRQPDLATRDHGMDPENGLPFHDPQNLPAGTLLTVRLKSAISAENPVANGTFEAVVDEPVVVDGNQLLPRGAIVAGRVESARASNVKRDRGSVRLVLDSIHLEGLNLSIQTSSLFVRGSADSTHFPQSQAHTGEVQQSPPSSAVIRLEKGRRLTFRLTEPAYVAASQGTRVDR